MHLERNGDVDEFKFDLITPTTTNVHYGGHHPPLVSAILKLRSSADSSSRRRRRSSPHPSHSSAPHRTSHSSAIHGPRIPRFRPAMELGLWLVYLRLCRRPQQVEEEGGAYPSGADCGGSGRLRYVVMLVVARLCQLIVLGLVGSSSDVSYFEGYYPGLVNLSGSYCFMNSTLQAMASLSYLQPHIDQVFNKAESLSTIVHTPVIDELRELLAGMCNYTSTRRFPMVMVNMTRYSLVFG